MRLATSVGYIRQSVRKDVCWLRRSSKSTFVGPEMERGEEKGVEWTVAPPMSSQGYREAVVRAGGFASILSGSCGDSLTVKALKYKHWMFCVCRLFPKEEKKKP